MFLPHCFVQDLRFFPSTDLHLLCLPLHNTNLFPLRAAGINPAFACRRAAVCSSRLTRGFWQNELFSPTRLRQSKCFPLGSPGPNLPFRYCTFPSCLIGIPAASCSPSPSLQAWTFLGPSPYVALHRGVPHTTWLLRWQTLPYYMTSLLSYCPASALGWRRVWVHHSTVMNSPACLQPHKEPVNPQGDRQTWQHPSHHANLFSL